MRVNTPLTDMLAEPYGKRTSQLLFGEPFQVLRIDRGHSYGKADCGYHGWVASAALEPGRATDHQVETLATFVYAKPDIKSELRLRLPYMARVLVQKTEGAFARIPEGYVFAAHLSAAPASDFVSEAERFLGVPYLWGGRSTLGIDCSGLVQLCLLASGVMTPRDSGPQAESIGQALPLDSPLVRGDLVFWHGHVGIMRDAETLLHATAFSMSVISEPLATTKARIEAQGEGKITAIRRV